MEEVFNFNNIGNAIFHFFGSMEPAFKSPIPREDKNDFTTNFQSKFSKNPSITPKFTVNKKSFNNVVMDVLKLNMSAATPLSYLHIFFYDDNFFDKSKNSLNILFRFSDRAYFLEDLDDIMGDKVYIINSTNDLVQTPSIAFARLLQNFVSTGNAGDTIMKNTSPKKKNFITKYISYELGQVLKHNGFPNVNSLEFETILISSKFSFTHWKYYSDNNERFSLAVKIRSSLTKGSNDDEYADAGDLNP